MKIICGFFIKKIPGTTKAGIHRPVTFTLFQSNNL